MCCVFSSPFIDADVLLLCRQWEYERLSPKWWQKVVYEVSESGSIAPLLKYHPFEAGG